MRFESLIFDIDGTLWDSRALVAEGYNLQLEKEGLSRYAVTAEELRPLFGKVMTEIADVLFPDLPAPERYSLMDRCMRTENAHLREIACDVGYPGVKQTVAALSEKSRLFIVSNSQRGYPELCMEKLGIAPYFRGQLCFGDTHADKARTIRVLMERYGITDCAYIGDTQLDRDAAVQAGIPFIWAAYGFGTPDGYDDWIDDIRELTEKLR